MPNDAKLGLIVGVGLVVLASVVFFRKDGPIGTPVAQVPSSTRGTSAAATGPGRGPIQAMPAKGTPRGESNRAVRRHTVQEGETLPDLALRYFGDREKSTEIARANPGVLSDSQELTPGTVLTIPDAPDGSPSAPTQATP